MTMYKKDKIGLDIDDRKKGKQLLKILRILKLKGFYRLSSSKRGYHFLIDTNNHTKKESLLIRYMLGDCYGRWYGDFRRLENGIKHFDLLFNKKKNKECGKWRKI